MATEAALVDTSSCVSEIIEVHSDVLVDLLVVLVKVFDAVAPSSPLEGLSIVAMLVDKMTLAVADWISVQLIGESSSWNMKVSDPGGSR